MVRESCHGVYCSCVYPHDKKMKEMFEEYGGIVAIAIIGLLVIAGFFEVIVLLKEQGII